jgi:alpha-galactosidase
VSGATFLRLVVNDGGDGVNNDHGDWADARLTCA